MIGHDLASAIGGHLRVPSLLRLRQPLLKILITLLEVGSVCGIQLTQLGRDTFGNAAAVVGIKPVMRIAERVDVTFSTRDLALRNLQDRGKLRGVQIALSRGLNFSVATLGYQRRQPANFQVQANQNQKIGIAQLEQEAGFRLYEMRVLVAFGQGLHIYLVAAHLLR